MKNTLFIFLGLALTTQALSQDYNPLLPPNTFRNTDNPGYWANNKPYEGYWQQDVHYRIKADVDERAEIISADLELTYWNNSPDTLYHVFFHLHQNAFQPGSYYDNLQENNDVKRYYSYYEAQGLGTVFPYVKYQGNEMKVELDNTVMKVLLDEPILPGQSVEFEIPFKTFYGRGSVRRRMKVYDSFGFKHFNGVHWYPRISVYDSKFGWNTDQHLGREFYADFGTFDVELTFASNYVVEATGYLTNREEVLPNDLRQQLDITNFKDKPLNEAPSIITPYDSTQRKTWVYHAENVHNFAFTADPTYRIGEVTWNGIRCIALVQEPHAANWQDVAQFTADVVKTYSQDIGMYGYHKMIVADAQDGMEYPMLTLCGGLYPGNKGLIAHEVGHNWFYGMIGNNETYRASLDEGFTQFLTSWSIEAIDGDYPDRDPPKNWYQRKFWEPPTVRFQRVVYGYMSDAIHGEDAPLNTHSDAFNGAVRHGGGYRHVYYKTAVMLYNLQYVLGDELFLEAMQHYFDQWKYKHPYFEDMRSSFIQYTDVDLNWFFDQWLETSKNVDYTVTKAKKTGQEGDNLTYDIHFKRIGRMQMPIDFIVVTKDGDTLAYHIPNTWFEKETDATVLPKWHGWDKLQPTYTATITVPGKIKDVIIDPSKRLADINMMNNHLKPHVDLQFDSRINRYPDYDEYDLNMRPDLWWNAYDGLKIGFHMNGNYMRDKHNMEFYLWGHTGLGQGDPSKYPFTEGTEDNFDPISYIFRYRTRMDKIMRKTSFFFEAKYLDGLEGYSLGIDKGFNNNKTNLILSFKLMTRPQEVKLNYLIYPNEWEDNKINTAINLALTHDYRYQKGSGEMEVYLRSSALASDYLYHYLQVKVVNHTRLWKLDLKSRVFGRYGTGNNLPGESALYVAGANGEAMMENKFVRSQGFVPPTWTGYSNEVNHFQHGGGLNLRGYAGYYITEEKDGDVHLVYKGNSGGALNIELDFDQLIKFKPKWVRDYFKLDTYLFVDGGFIVFTEDDGTESFAEPRMDAGAGIALTVKKFGPLQNVKPLTIRFDVPFYISHAPFAEPDNVKFRWVVGVNRAF